MGSHLAKTFSYPIVAKAHNWVTMTDYMDEGCL